jgi:hypothetical protein
MLGDLAGSLVYSDPERTLGVVRLGGGKFSYDD